MDERDYEVGYGKPPVSTRFQKGHKGHPRRPKPAPTLSEQLDAILEEKVMVTENGRSRRIAKEDVFLRQLVNRGIAGNRHSEGLLYHYLVERQRRPGRADTRETDEFLMAELLKSMRGNREESADEPF